MYLRSEKTGKQRSKESILYSGEDKEKHNPGRTKRY
jgi:hypothetical protein